MTCRYRGIHQPEAVVHMNICDEVKEQTRENITICYFKRRLKSDFQIDTVFLMLKLGNCMKMTEQPQR